MLEIQSLSVAYGSRPALEDVTFQVAKGEVVALIGPNGAGKTTLMRTVSGVLAARSGRVLVDGQDFKRLSPPQRASYLAVVPQARDLPALFTVWQTVLLGRTPYLGWLGQASAADQARARWALERTHLLPLAERSIGQLSGGEQQRVLLARALAQDTPILLLDEPTTHLDLQHQSILLNLVQELAREQGLAILMALHDLNLAALYADRVALLVSGSLSALGTPSEVLTPSNLAAAYQVPVHVIPHPDYGTPLVLPDGRL
ncbi:MAG TPA: heme ABC transporter ATP-binding protein [Anaerolineales bacterium]